MKQHSFSSVPNEIFGAPLACVIIVLHPKDLHDLSDALSYPHTTIQSALREWNDVDHGILEIMEKLRMVWSRTAVHTYARARELQAVQLTSRLGSSCRHQWRSSSCMNRCMEVVPSCTEADALQQLVHCLGLVVHCLLIN